jgi:hypothetical protein
MERGTQVLLRRNEAGGFVEVATIVARESNKAMTIRLPDGTEEQHVRRADEITVERGSVTHMLRVSPERVAADLGEEPAAVFRALLAEMGKPVKASVLKDRLHGVDRDLVDKAWERAKRKLDQDPDVIRSSDRVPTYRVAPRATTAPSASSQHELQRPAARGAESQPPRDRGGEASAPPEKLIAEVSSSSGEPTKDPLLEGLQTLGAAKAGEDRAALARRPLSLGLDLARIKAVDLRALLDSIEQHDRALLALVLGEGKERLLAREARLLTAAQYEGTLRAGIGELARAGSEAKRLYPPLTGLLERAAKSVPLSSQLLVDLARTFGDASRAGRDGLHMSLTALARSLSSEGASELGTWDLPLLARVARRADFARTGGRSALLVALYQVVPSEAVAAPWWEGASFDQLAEAGHGPLAKVLQDPVVAASVVQPIVEKALAETSTRSGLGRLLTAPAPLAEWVSGQGLKDAILRVGQGDVIVDRWAAVLTDAGAVRQLSSDLENAREEARSSRDYAQAQEQRAAALEERVERLSHQLAEMRGSQVELRGAHERQLKLDLIRTIARMAAQVSQSAQLGQDEALARSISHATSREGLKPIGRQGGMDAFDPSIHDPMGANLDTGAEVVVVRQGYTWVHDDEAVVILKAQVAQSGR